MGTDIHGYVEVKKYSTWDDCIDISSIVYRNYDMFALLFGIRNDAHFIPIAPHRGLPNFISDRVKGDFDGWGLDAHSPSWITWQEIANINWNEHGTQLANRVFCYKPGETTSFASFGWSSTLDKEDYDAMDRGETIEKYSNLDNGIVRYRRETQKTSDALSADWQCLFDLMRCLNDYHVMSDRHAEEYTVESSAVPALPVDNCKVRLVVWFDN